MSVATASNDRPIPRFNSIFQLRFTSRVHMTNVHRSTPAAMKHLQEHLKKHLRSHSVSVNVDGNILIDSVCKLLSSAKSLLAMW